MLEVENIYKSYGNVKALNGVTFSLEKGETKVIAGPSGAGKSTLLKCINLLIKPDRGRIFLEGEEITSPNTNISKVRQKIGFVFQEFNLFNHLTVLGNVMIGLTKVKKMPKEEALRRAKEALEMVHIGEDLWDRYPSQISGGEKQRTAIARALAMDPVLMLYDEPTSALDPNLAAEVLQVIKVLSRSGRTSLIVTHEMSFALEVADEMLFMFDGRIVHAASPVELLSNPKHELASRFLRLGGGNGFLG
jgi:polar amino acid transport system ATP-binding protein